MSQDPTAPSTSNERTYILDSESTVEMARLVKQDQIFTKNMGGVFSEQSAEQLASLHTILDIGCGPGSWVLQVAQAYPDKKVVGCDISYHMIEYAQEQAAILSLENASFQKMDVTHGLDFPDQSFDLVNARLIGGFMPRQLWPRLLQECLRVTQSGGLLRLTECEASFTTSPACTWMSQLFTQALHRSRLSFSPDGSTIGLTPVLKRLLRDVGYQQIQHRAYALDYSFGTEAHGVTYENMMVSSKLMQPFLIRMGVITQPEIDEAYEQALLEMSRDDFCAIWYYLTAWGQKPST